MKKEIMNFMKEFHSNSRLGFGVNCSFAKENPVDIGDFRPISLINSVYKILSKVLASRFKQVLPAVVDHVQYAFLGERSIMNGVLIANEVVDWWKKLKKKGLILKLDFEKAYDSINWNFLLQMLEKFGFGSKWIGWMKECLASARVSVLVNGSPTAEFCPKRGLRQGDPLSPFLFNVVAEGLNILLIRAKEMGLLKGVEVGPGKINVSHL